MPAFLGDMAVVCPSHCNLGCCELLPAGGSSDECEWTQVQKQFNSLPKEDRPALLASLQACLQRVTQRCTLAISPLAVALAALIVQSPAWTGSLQQIGAGLTPATTVAKSFCYCVPPCQQLACHT